MKISDLKGRLTDILEVPKDPIHASRRLERANGKEGFFPQASPLISYILNRAFRFQCIWEEFEETLEEEGKNLSDDVTFAERELFIASIVDFFARLQIPQADEKLRKEVQEEKRILLEAIGDLRQDLFK